MNEQMKKMWQSYLALKKEEIYPNATKWKNLEDIILSEKASQRSTIYILITRVPILEGQKLMFPA